MTEIYHIWYTKSGQTIGNSLSMAYGQVNLIEKKGQIMLVSFINAFLSRFIVLLVIVVVVAVALAIGITMAKKKNEANAAGKGKNE